MAGTGAILSPSVGAGTTASPMAGSSAVGNAGMGSPAGMTGGGGTTSMMTAGTSASMGGSSASAGMGAGGTDAAAGSGGAGGTIGEGGTGAGGTGSPTTRTAKPYCISAGSQGVFIGDSYVNFINNQEPRVRQLAIDDGALPSGMRYRDVAVAGTSLNYGLGAIPTQWEGIKSSDVRFVVMDGGGNDVLINNSFCLNTGSGMNATCQGIAMESADTLTMMWTSMKAAGVRDVVMFYYPHTPYGAPGSAEILDYAYPLMKDACEALNDATFTCHFVDTRMAFEGHANYIGSDNIHPTGTGADVIADLIYTKMKENCIGQPMASGCCEAK